MLTIRKCPKLVSFPEASLPPMLRSLSIRDCSSLESLPNYNSCLEELHLWNCSSLRSLPMDTFPSTIKSIYINDCMNLDSISEMKIELDCFRVSDWPNLELLRVFAPDFSYVLSYNVGLSFPPGSDDVWNEDYTKWDLLRAPFQVGVPGSKIIVTTRNEGVASTMGSIPTYHLKELADDDCLSLLAQHALGTSNFGAHPNLKEIGVAIMSKCQGLPLAVKTLGGILHNKHSSNEWKDVLDCEIWNLPGHKSGILPALRVSYHHLPSHLKQMFAYCAIFPKDYEFDKDELVLLWMAEGFLPQSEGMKCMEELGNNCFNELLSRSFFQRSGGMESKFVMHDLLNDLAQYVVGKICFWLDDSIESNEQCKISQKARHLAFIRHHYEEYKRFKSLHGLRSVRTFLPVPVYKSYNWARFYLSNSILVELLPKLRYLRILSLSGYYINQLPNSIGDLKHLRYLNLSATSIEWLPESVCALHNLQTLLLRGCNALCKLPTDIGNLVNLRHLDNSDTVNLQEMPLGISKLTSLQTLPKIIVCKNGGLRLRDLKNMLLLRGMLSIVGLENVMDVRDADDANLSSKQNIHELELIWSSGIGGSQNEELQVNMLDILRPNRELKCLKIGFYRGSTFPSWIGDPSLSKTVRIDLRDCTNCVSLPPLGQLPILKELHIQGMHAVKSIGAEFYGVGSALETRFPSLETLSFEGMPEWEEWSCGNAGEFVGHLPRLHELTMVHCPKLVSVSLLRLLSLRKLTIISCSEAVLKSFSELTSLNTLKIWNISGLTHLQEEFTHFLVSLQVLELGDCDMLVTLLKGGITPQHLSHLQCLHVEGCSQLVCLVEEAQMLHCNLESLEVHDCDRLERLPTGLKNHTSLKKLTIRKCPKLVSFPEASLPPMLRSLSIRDCSSLESLPNYNSCLEELHLWNCSSLRSLPMDTFPSTIKSIYIKDCMNLDSISEMKIELDCFRISDWPNLELLRVFAPDFSYVLSYNIGLSFPPGSGLLTPNLRRLSIKGMANDISLKGKFESLTSLEELSMSDCQSLGSFPDGNLPPNLTKLQINRCGKLKPLSEWGLHRLSSLRTFLMMDVYPELRSFLDEGLLLPSSVKSLVIASMPNLKSLGLQNLSSLNYLEIFDCPNLRSLPDVLTTLSSLRIMRCPHLKRRFSKEKGMDWPKIAGIPYVDIV
ncbi:unnamed protein product [Ilex paraguariensis]|uniref:NB-ARC domain-containing protein n=1 Tax=Ilex paraguariensis TaxID=185542 RepID=A0ABC8U5W3_9AQUA